MDSLVDACIASPIGAALLGLLERRQRSPRTWLVDDPTSDPALVADAVTFMQTRSFAQICAQILEASENVGPWIGGGPDEAWAAYLHVEERRPIAAALAERFGDELCRPLDVESQEWWLYPYYGSAAEPLFVNHGRVYENGELSWHALRSRTRQGPEVREWADGEIPRPITRWHLPVTGEPRVYEIHRPSDWHKLCVTYPRPAKQNHATWAFSPPYKRHPLLQLPGQHAMAKRVDAHLCPNWVDISRDYDAVHLSWAGFLTAEGYILTNHSATTILRYWGSELTMWLNDCFGELTPIEDPTPADGFLDPFTNPERLGEDQAKIRAALGR